MTSLHKLDSPTIKWSNGDKEWLVNGYLHRIDGPAVERNDEYKQKPLFSYSFNKEERWYIHDIIFDDITDFLIAYGCLEYGE